MVEKTINDIMDIDIRIIQKPTHVIWECHNCEHENISEYKDFLSGKEYEDWQYETIECEECKSKFIIDEIHWD